MTKGKLIGLTVAAAALSFASLSALAASKEVRCYGVPADKIGDMKVMTVKSKKHHGSNVTYVMMKKVDCKNAGGSTKLSKVKVVKTTVSTPSDTTTSTTTAPADSTTTTTTAPASTDASTGASTDTSGSSTTTTTTPATGTQQ